MKSNLALLIGSLSVAMISCTPQNDPFEISKEAVGKLSKQSTIKELKTLYAADSIVTNDSLGLANGNSLSRIWILDKEGTQLVSLTPKNDTTHTIESVRILDPRFKTSKGIHLNSTIKELKKAYTISKITGTINSVAISVKESPAFFTIDRKLLPGDLRFKYDEPIEAVHLPDEAPITKIIVNW